MNHSHVILPELGEGILTAVVSFLYANVGDQVQEGDDIIELTTDKATFNVSAQTSGTIKAILVNISDTVPIGQTLAMIE